MSKKENTEIQKKQETAIGQAMKPGRGFEEGCTKEELIIPRAKLCQALTPEVQDDDFPEIKNGMIINSLTKEILPDIFLPVFKYTEWIRFNPRDRKAEGFSADYEPGAIIWRSKDPEDPRVLKEGQFGPEGQKPLAIQILNFFSYFPGVPMPVVVGFSKTSFKAGRELLSLARFSQGDMFSKKYRLSSKEQESDGTKYFVLTVKPAGKAEEDDFRVAESLFEEFRGREIKVDDDIIAEATESEKESFSEAAPF